MHVVLVVLEVVVAVPVAAIVVVLLFSAGLCVFAGVPRYVGPRSDHFTGERFFNPERPRQTGSGSLIKWLVTRERGPWRDRPPDPRFPAPPTRVGEGEFRVTFINHSTVLLQWPGLNVLTDPIWAKRASPVQWAGPRRFRDPGVRLEDLPPIDVVLLSHNHYDHFDHRTMKRLSDSHRPRIITALGNSALLSRYEVKSAEELDWWASVDLSPDVRLTAVPAQHFSGRATCDRNRALWCGFVISAPGGPVYFAGDTGFGSHFAEIRRRFGPQRVAVLPIGAFRPRWFMAPVHISPDEALEAHGILEPNASVAIHFGTFPLADDGQDEPVQLLTEAIARVHGDGRPFWILGFGEGRSVAPVASTAGAIR